MIFVMKTFVDCSFLPCQRTPHAQISWRKLLQIATKPWHLQKFSPLKVSRYTVNKQCCIFCRGLVCWLSDYSAKIHSSKWSPLVYRSYNSPLLWAKSSSLFPPCLLQHLVTHVLFCELVLTVVWEVCEEMRREEGWTGGGRKGGSYFATV